MSFIKSVVLSCAGIGSRLGIGQTKALIDINGRSLISRHLENFSEVEDLRIVIGFQSQAVIAEVLKYRRNVIFVYNHDYFDTKTGASFYLGARDAEEYVLEWDGDLLVHPDDIKKCLEYPGEFVGYSQKSSDEAVFINLNQRGQVINFSRKNGAYEWTGPVCLRREKIFYSRENVFNQVEPHLPLPGLFLQAYDIDTYDDYLRTIELVRKW